MSPLLMIGGALGLILASKKSVEKEVESFECPVCTSDAYRSEPPCIRCHEHHGMLVKQDRAIKAMKDVLEKVQGEQKAEIRELKEEHHRDVERMHEIRDNWHRRQQVLAFGAGIFWGAMMVIAIFKSSGAI